MRTLRLGGRQGRGDPSLARTNDGEPTRGLLVSRAFWIGGLLSVAVWAFIAWVIA